MGFAGAIGALASLSELAVDAQTQRRGVPVEMQNSLRRFARNLRNATVFVADVVVDEKNLDLLCAFGEQVEFHFGVFVTLALLLVWSLRPDLLAALSEWLSSSNVSVDYP